MLLVLELPGCLMQGTRIDECRERAAAIAVHIARREADGEEVPEELGTPVHSLRRRQTLFRGLRCSHRSSRSSWVSSCCSSASGVRTWPRMHCRLMDRPTDVVGESTDDDQVP